MKFAAVANEHTLIQLLPLMLLGFELYRRRVISHNVYGRFASRGVLTFEEPVLKKTLFVIYSWRTIYLRVAVNLEAEILYAMVSCLLERSADVTSQTQLVFANTDYLCGLPGFRSRDIAVGKVVLA